MASSNHLHITHVIGADDPPVAVPPPRPANAFDLLAAQPWAMLPAMLETMSAIARREGEPLEALEARLGRPLQNTRTVSLRDGVAVVPVVGPIFRYANLLTQVSGATSLDVLATEFTSALDNPQVDAIVLAIDSPGGQAAGMAEFAQLIRGAGKPVTAYVDGAAASAAYWIAAAADRVVLSKTAEVGSIGAVVAIDTGRSRDGVMEIVSSQSPKKRPDVTTETGRSQIQARLDALAQVFVDDVAAYRGVSVDTVLADFGQGDMRMGAAAVALGMADEVSTLDAVIAGLAGSKTTGGPRMGAKTETDPLIYTREALAAHAPDLLAALLAEGHATGATAERERMLSVEAQALPGHEALIERLKADGVTTGPQAAVQVLQAEKATAGKRLADLAADAPAPLAFVADNGVAENAAPQADAQAKNYAAEIQRRVAAAKEIGRTLTPSQAMQQIKQEATHG